ncbi:S8 family serine peptidase [Streptomyces sp. NPDC059894]|uniref:S8 family serine peptidase n=1 Tax=unclassified Streptomyces TaxID=2593676 RepID=UPI00364DE1D7
MFAKLRRGLPSVVVLSVALATLLPAPSATAGPVADGVFSGGASQAFDSAETITLITGDVVTVANVDGRLTYTIDPAPGRRGIGYREERGPGADGTEHVSLIPFDAEALVYAGKLDARLFDLTELAAAGYTDADTDALPLLVGYDEPGATHRTLAGGSHVTHTLESIDAVALDQDKSSAGALWDTLVTDETASTLDLGSHVSKVWLNGRMEVRDDVSVPQIGAPDAWAAGYDGTGTTVAVLDTGYDQTHPDLAGRVADAKDFTGSPNGTKDMHGHGTHVATTIAGDAAASDGKYVGVAPGATVIVGKVLGDSGSGTQAGVIDGMEWAAGEGADIISMSLGGYASDGTDPESLALNALTEQTGALFVVAAGNAGAAETIGSPGSADAALTVGAVDSANALASFSSRGPRVFDGAVKPDLTGPGVAVTAGRSSTGSAGTPVNQYYTRMSGTSMATPHVAGAAAILKQLHPDWTARQLKPFLTSTAVPGAYTVFQQGTGRVDLTRGVTQSAYASPASISTYLEYPADKSVTKTVTYHNDGDSDLNLTLSLAARNNATGAATGLFSLDRTAVVVPAHGTADVTLTMDPSADDFGVYGGVITAVDGDTRILTAVGAYKEVETHTVHFPITAKNGDAVSYGSVSMSRPLNLTTGKRHTIGIDYKAGELYARLPKGTYSFEGYAYYPTDEENTRDVGYTLKPSVVVDDDIDVAFDQSETTPVSIKVDRAEAYDAYQTFYALQTVNGTVYGGGVHLTGIRGTRNHLTATPTPAVTDRRYEVFYRTNKIDPLADPYLDEPVAGRYAYNLIHSFGNRVPAKATLRRHNRDLAAVRENYHAPATPDGAFGRQSDYPRFGGYSFPTLPHVVPYGDDVVHYYSTEPGTSWASQVSYYDGAGAQLAYESTPFIERAKGKSEVDWFGSPQTSAAYASRAAGTDRLTVAYAPFSSFTAGHMGTSTASRSLTLARDGVTLGTSSGTSASFTVPASAGTYTLTGTATRQAAWTDLATGVHTRWTFHSAQAATAAYAPLYTVRADAHTDLTGRVRGPSATVDITLDPGYATGEKITTVTAQVSFDDGATWAKAPLAHIAAGWRAHVPRPRGEGHASLKITGVDTSGNSVEQTTIRAFAFG